MKVGDGKDDHPSIHCSEVGFVVSLIIGMAQVEYQTCISLHRDTATTSLGLFLSIWLAAVVNIW